MKITINKPEEKIYTFSDLGVNDRFMYKSHGLSYMVFIKTSQTLAINLGSGSVNCFDSNERVIPVTIKEIIVEKK